MSTDVAAAVHGGVTKGGLRTQDPEQRPVYDFFQGHTSGKPLVGHGFGEGSRRAGQAKDEHHGHEPSAAGKARAAKGVSGSERCTQAAEDAKD